MTYGILVLEHPELSPMPMEIDFTDFVPEVPWDQVDPATRAIMEARVARGDGLTPLGLVECESATNTPHGIVVQTEIWYAYSGTNGHSYI